MRDISVVANDKNLGWKGAFVKLFLEIAPPSYLAESIDDFLTDRHNVSRTANVAQAWVTQDFPYHRAIIYLPEVIYRGVNEQGLVELDDITGNISLYPQNAENFEKTSVEEGLHYGQKVIALLTYDPKKDIAWIWQLSVPKIQKGVNVPAAASVFTFSQI